MRNSFFRGFFCIMLLVSLLQITACYADREREYYAEKTNYCEITGVVTQISYAESGDALYFSCEQLSMPLDDHAFKLVGGCFTSALENGAAEKLQVGQEVQFITAPRYFGDGYIYPVVGIRINEEELLSFEEGYGFLLEWLAGGQ